MSSIGGQLALAGQGNYAASKAGQIALSKSMAKEVAKKGVTVNCVCPGFIDTVLISDLPAEQISEYKKQAMSLLLKKYKADAFIGPLTDVTTTADGRMMISISGFPAQYVNFRNATSADVWIVSLYSVIDRNSTESLNSVDTKTVLIK